MGGEARHRITFEDVGEAGSLQGRVQDHPKGSCGDGLTGLMRLKVTDVPREHKLALEREKSPKIAQPARLGGRMITQRKPPSSMKMMPFLANLRQQLPTKQLWNA
jgi:hypothetical protein